MLERNGILKIASVGDCGLRVIREGKTQSFSSDQVLSYLWIFFSIHFILNDMVV